MYDLVFPLSDDVGIFMERGSEVGLTVIHCDLSLSDLVCFGDVSRCQDIYTYDRVIEEVVFLYVV
jgi:hypothetical protein